MKKIDWTAFLLIPGMFISATIVAVSILDGNISFWTIFYGLVTVWFYIIASALLQKKKVNSISHALASATSALIITVAILVFII